MISDPVFLLTPMATFCGFIYHSRSQARGTQAPHILKIYLSIALLCGLDELLFCFLEEEWYYMLNQQTKPGLSSVHFNSFFPLCQYKVHNKLGRRVKPRRQSFLWHFHENSDAGHLIASALPSFCSPCT